MKIQPSRDYVLVLPQKINETTESGIYLPQNDGRRPGRGEVMAVGPGRTDTGCVVPVGVKPGDVVLYQPHTGLPVDEPRGLLLIREADILATIDTAPESSSPQ